MRGSSDAWMDDAACKGLNPNLFFPERGASAAEAKRVCASCPVAADCLAFAYRERIGHGVWGGLPEQSRRRNRALMPFERLCVYCHQRFAAVTNKRLCSPECARLRKNEMYRKSRVSSGGEAA